MRDYIYFHSMQIELSRVVRKPDFCICENKDADQHREADQCLCFRYMDSTIPLLSTVNPKFQASSHLMWVYSLVCVGPGRKPWRPVFSERGSNTFNMKSRTDHECVWWLLKDNFCQFNFSIKTNVVGAHWNCNRHRSRLWVHDKNPHTIAYL